MLKRALQIVLTILILAVLLFLSAGTLAWPGAWLLLGLMLASLAGNFIVILRFNPGIAETRSKMRQGTKGWDKVLMAVYSLLYLAFPVVAGLDAVRLGWSSLPAAYLYPGLVLYALGSALIAWVLATNPFLETTVRIQEERGHRVITTGPYAIVRHPMYLGLLIQYLGLPLILGSVWSFATAAAIIAVFIIRTAREDRTLFTELPGYGEYSRKTRWRLMLGAW